MLVHPTTVGGFAAIATRLIRKGEEVGPNTMYIGMPASTAQPCTVRTLFQRIRSHLCAVHVSQLTRQERLASRDLLRWSRRGCVRQRTSAGSVLVHERLQAQRLLPVPLRLHPGEAPAAAVHARRAGRHAVRDARP